MTEDKVVKKLKENFYKRIDKHDELQFLDSSTLNHALCLEIAECTFAEKAISYEDLCHQIPRKLGSRSTILNSLNYAVAEGYFIKEYGYKNFFENVVTINFNHRWLATITFTIIIIFLIYNFLTKRYHNYNFHMMIIFLFAILQFLLGILTLLSNVEVILASLHQVNSMLLLASIIYFYHSIKKQ